MGADVCATGLVGSEPASVDHLGTHAPIAEAIAHLISSSRQGRTIGLEGGWGSGKSSVIRLLQGELSKDPWVRVTVFDAWAHEGDPLRRTFLERVFADLKKADWIDSARVVQWEKRLSELTGRVSETITIPKTTVTRWGQALGFAGLLAPIGVAVVSATLSSAFGDNPSSYWGYLLVLGMLLFLLFPILAILGGSQDVAFLSVGAVHTKKDVTTQTTDPTSLEFEELFRGILRDAIGQEQGRKLVVVVDNLDRLLPEQSLTIWTTLQTFLQRPAEQADWEQRLWILLPYDRDAIRLLWSDRGDSRAATYSGGSAGSSSVDQVAESFLDKSVQVRFEVPPAALSNWRQYLTRRLRVVLPDTGQHPDEELRRVVAVLTARIGGKSRPPTPRELDQFANEIGALHRRWSEAHPNLLILAVYAAYRRGFGPTESDFAAKLVSRDIPTAREIGVTGIDEDSLRLGLAAVWYGVDVDRALELLLASPTREALRSGTDLEEMVGVTGFWEVLETIDFSEFEPAELLAAARVLDALRERHETAPAWGPGSTVRSSYADLLRKARVPLNEPAIVAAGIRFAGDHRASQHVIDVIAGTDISSDVAVVNMAGLLGIVIPALIDTHPTETLIVSLAVPASQFVRFSEAVDPLTDEALDRLRLIAMDAAEATSTLVSEILAGRVILVAPVQRVSGAIGIQLDWPRVADALGERLKAGEVVAPESGQLLDAIRTTGGSLQLAEVVRAGWALHHLQQTPESDLARRSDWLVVYLGMFPGNDSSDRVGVAEEGARFVSDFGGRPNEIGDLLDALGRRVADSADRWTFIADLRGEMEPLAIALIAHVVGSDGLTGPYVVEHWDRFREARGSAVDPVAFNESVVAADGLSEAILAGEFSPSRADLCQVAAPLLPDVRTWVRAELGVRPQAEWDDALRDRSALLELALQECAASSGDWPIPRALLHALDALMAVLVAGQPTGARPDDLALFFNAMDAVDRSSLLRAAARAAERSEDAIAAEFFEIAGPALLAVGHLVLGENDFVDAARNAVNRGDVRTIRWFAGVARASRGNDSAVTVAITRDAQSALSGSDISDDLTAALTDLIEALAPSDTTEGKK